MYGRLRLRCINPLPFIYRDRGHTVVHDTDTAVRRYYHIFASCLPHLAPHTASPRRSTDSSNTRHTGLLSASMHARLCPLQAAGGGVGGKRAGRPIDGRGPGMELEHGRMGTQHTQSVGEWERHSIRQCTVLPDK